MSVFISYSHCDSEIVEKIATYLVSRNIHIWIDKWQLNYGDSLIAKIQDAITESSVLLIMLSTESVKSEWCKKELTAGLVRELEEKRVVTIPVLLEDCDIPLFLKDKYYADFRNDFDQTIKSLQDSLLKFTDITLNRVENENYLIDWGIDNGIRDDIFYFDIDSVSFEKGGEHSVLCTVHIIGNDKVSKLYKQAKIKNEEHIIVSELIIMLAEMDKRGNLRIRLVDNDPIRKSLVIIDDHHGYEFKMDIYTRRLGINNGFDILFDFGSILRLIGEKREHILRR